MGPRIHGIRVSNTWSPARVRLIRAPISLLRTPIRGMGPRICLLRARISLTAARISVLRGPIPCLRMAIRESSMSNPANFKLNVEAPVLSLRLTGTLWKVALLGADVLTDSPVANVAKFVDGTPRREHQADYSRGAVFGSENPRQGGVYRLGPNDDAATKIDLV